MKVIIAGSRSIDDYHTVKEAVKSSGYEITEVVSGCAVGPDRFGEAWALINNVPVKEMPADFALHGKAAGPIRNKKMAEYADAAVIIWDGESAGTRNMIENMIRRKKPYHLQLTSANLEGYL